MRRGDGLWVVDTNVVVAGLLTGAPEAPPAVILDNMMSGEIRCLLSIELLAEYRAVILRRKIRSRHGMTPAQVDRILEAVATHAVVIEIENREAAAPDPGDDHLWQLLASAPGAGLITGDALLLSNPPAGTTIVTPGDWLHGQ